MATTPTRSRSTSALTHRGSPRSFFRCLILSRYLPSSSPSPPPPPSRRARQEHKGPRFPRMASPAAASSSLLKRAGAAASSLLRRAAASRLLLSRAAADAASSLLRRAAAAASSLLRRATACRLLPSRAFASGGGEKAKRVLVPVAAGTEPIEAVATADLLNRAGAQVTVATVDPRKDDSLVVEAAYGVKLVADGRVADFEGETFDLIALPGGMPGSVNLRDCKVLEDMVKKHAENGGLYGAICAAPAVTLAYWGMLKGLKATCYPSFMEKFTAEVIPVNSRVVVDRNAVTSQGPGTAIEFGLALVEQLYGKEKMEEVAGPLYVRPQHGAEYTVKEFNSLEWKCSGTPQVLVPVANGSEEMEALNLIDVLRRAGANVTVASVEDKLQIVTRHHKFNLIADMMLDEAAKMQFDLIVMPGGLPGAKKFSSTKKLVDLLKKQAESNKPYGAICASPAYVLEPHGLLEGKKATAFPPMAYLLSDQSACQYRVVVDGNLITSRAPGTATEFALAIVEKLFGREKAVSIAKDLIFM